MAVRRRPTNNSVSEDNNMEDQTPTTERTSSRSIRSRAVDSGWGSAREERTESVKADFLDLRDGRKLVKFLDAIPPVRFARHYVGGRFHNCPESLGELPEGESCPLCDKGNRPSQAFLMNVLDLTEGPDNSGIWKVKTYTFGVEVRNQLLSFLEDEHKFPSLDDEKWYWEIKSVKDNATNRKSTKIMPVKLRDLQDDYGIEPLTQDEFDEALEGRYDERSIFKPFLDKLREIARSISQD